MALQTSGKISHSDIMAEFGYAANSQWKLSTDGGPLINYPSGQPVVKESDFYGASNVTGATLVQGFGHSASTSLTTGGAGSPYTRTWNIPAQAGDLVLYYYGDAGFHQKTFGVDLVGGSAFSAAFSSREVVWTASRIDRMYSKTFAYVMQSAQPNLQFTITSNQYAQGPYDGACVITNGANWGVTHKQTGSTFNGAGNAVGNFVYSTVAPPGNYILVSGGSWKTRGGGGEGARTWQLAENSTSGANAGASYTQSHAYIDTNGNPDFTDAREPGTSNGLWHPTETTHQNPMTMGGAASIVIPGTSTEAKVHQNTVGATNPTAYYMLISYDTV